MPLSNIEWCTDHLEFFVVCLSPSRPGQYFRWRQLSLTLFPYDSYKLVYAKRRLITTLTKVSCGHYLESVERSPQFHILIRVVQFNIVYQYYISYIYIHTQTPLTQRLSSQSLGQIYLLHAFCPEMLSFLDYSRRVHIVTFHCEVFSIPMLLRVSSV